jgi:type I restriction enzyme S subunit
MSSRLLPLSDICSNESRRFIPPASGKVWFINTGDVLEGAFLHHSISDWHGLPGQAKKAIRKHDLLYSEIRPGNGRYAFVEDDFDDAVVSTKFMVLQAKINTLPRYLYHLLTSSETQEVMKQIADSRSGTFPQITFESISHLEFYIPSLQEQQLISDALDLFEHKINLNLKTNETLEAMAKALFKSWFVDFDPVRAKAEGCHTGLPAEISDLFPDSFEDSELGEIPSGWGTTCLDELTSFVIGGDWGKDAWSESEQSKVLCLRGADIPSLQAFALGKPPTRFLKESSCEKRTLVDGDIVLEISGGSTDQSTGRPVVISSELIERAGTRLTCSNFCRLIRFDDLRWSSYIYYFLLSLYQSGEMFQYETGTTGIKNFGYKYFAGGRFFPKPPTALLDLFHCQIKSNHSSCHQRGKESDLLSKTRDTLLPKLISGEIRIPDAERMLEEVGV